MVPALDMSIRAMVAYISTGATKLQSAAITYSIWINPDLARQENEAKGIYFPEDDQDIKEWW